MVYSSDAAVRERIGFQTAQNLYPANSFIDGTTTVVGHDLEVSLLRLNKVLTSGWLWEVGIVSKHDNR